MFSNIVHCRVCNESKLKDLVHIDRMLPAGLYTDEPVSVEMPLTVCRCGACGHVQLRQTISSDLYADYLYTSDVSPDVMTYLRGLAQRIQEENEIRHMEVLEIGSSDGSFLKFFADRNRVLGVEPSKGLSDTAMEQNSVPTISSYFCEELALAKQDLILCRHVLEHVHEIDEFITSVVKFCKSGTLFLVEVPALEKIIEGKIFSNFFHEHLNYFSMPYLRALLSKYGFEYVSDYRNQIHGGSIGLVVKYTGCSKIEWPDALEGEAGFFDAMGDYIRDAGNLLPGNNFLGYGAAHRTSFLLSIYGLVDKVDYVVDKNRHYHGKYIGGTNIRIFNPDKLNSEQDRRIILFAISYEQEIVNSNLTVAGKNRFISVKGDQPSDIDGIGWISRRIRRNIVKMNAAAHASHSGSALSIVDILSVLYFRVMNLDPGRPKLESRDRFILSKGHASSALYSTLAERGFFDKSVLDGFYKNNGTLPGHLDMTAAPGVEASSGSLGHGLSIGIGMAIATKGDASRVYVLCGDGELNEGSVWEAIMFAPQHLGGELILIIDCNGLQGFGRTQNVVNLESIPDKFKAFNWDVVEVNGHDHQELEDALTSSTDRPKVLIARTVKGKGVSFMEDQFVWHYKSPDPDQLICALSELE